MMIPFINGGGSGDNVAAWSKDEREIVGGIAA